MTSLVTLPPSPAPSRTDPANFAARADAYHAWLVPAVEEMNDQNAENNTLHQEVTEARDELLAAGLANAAVHATTAATQAGIATGQASAAIAAAASAAAVAALDVSAASAVALHRSPNATVDVRIYDIGRDTDGGAWADRHGGASWGVDALAGAWRGALANEAAARAISGAATGDYFQSTADGRFYALAAGSGVSEVFVGNSRPHPRLAAGVLEAGRMVIYDLTATGRPMWRVFANTGALAGVGTLQCVAAAQGIWFLGGTTGSARLDFGGDALGVRNASSAQIKVGVAAWASATGLTADAASGALVAADVRMISALALPEAPSCPRTGLRQPHVAVLTSGGLTLIRPDSSTSSLAFAYSNDSAALVGDGVLVWSQAASSNGTLWRRVADIAAGTFTAQRSSLANPVYTSRGARMRAYTARGVAYGYDTVLGRIEYFAPYRLHDSSASLTGCVTPEATTGLLVGDVRRAWLAESLAGAMSSSAVISGDASTFAGGVGGWASASAFAASVAAASGKLQVTATVDNGRAVLALATVAGRAYTVTVTGRRVSGSNRIALMVTGSTGAFVASPQTNLPAYEAGAVSTSTSDVLLSLSFVAQAATSYIALGAFGTGTAGQVSEWDDVTVVEGSHNRRRRYDFGGSAVLGALRLIGSLTRVAVAAGAQLCGVSGFGASNYLQEPASADLDVGTGPLSAAAWCTVPAGNAAAGTLIDRSAASGAGWSLGVTAGNLLTATVTDGSASRTVTTSVAYNTGEWLHVRMNYSTDGRLALLVNGREAAAATGTALGSLANAAAVCTVGNDRAAASAWPGSVALVQIGATVPTADQALFAWRKEAPMFAAGAQVLLPAGDNPVSICRDPESGVTQIVQAGFRSLWRGLVRTASQAVPAGSYLRGDIAAGGVEVLARSSYGAELWLPAVPVRSRLQSPRLAALPERGGDFCVDITAVAGQTDFAAPNGARIVRAASAGAVKRYGATADYTLIDDGVGGQVARFAVAPGAGVWVQLLCERVTEGV